MPGTTNAISVAKLKEQTKLLHIPLFRCEMGVGVHFGKLFMG